jgi:hypothetical protein
LYRAIFFGQFARSYDNYPIVPEGQRRIMRTVRPPGVSEDKDLAIAVVSISTPERHACAQHSYPLLKEYTGVWGYTLKIHNAMLDSSRSVRWSKIKAILDELKTGTYDWVAWFDDDVLVTNLLMPLEQFIHEYGKQADFIISAERVSPQADNEINTGVLLIKNTPWAKEFLQRVWDYGNEHHCNEQEAIAALMAAEFKYDQHINRVPVCQIQSFFEDHPCDYGQWKENDFSMHLSRKSLEDKAAISKRMLNKIAQDLTSLQRLS